MHPIRLINLTVKIICHIYKNLFGSLSLFNNPFFFLLLCVTCQLRKPKNRRQDLEDDVGKEAIKMAKLHL